MDLALHPLDRSRRADFRAVMATGSEESAQCLCTAHHGAQDPAACRDRMFEERRSDGFLLYADGKPAAWCQCGPWDSFAIHAKRPAPIPGAWAITCLVVAAEWKGRRLAHEVFRRVLAELRARGAAAAVAFGHRLGPTYSSPLAELPESVCVRGGLTLLRDDPECPVYGICFEKPPCAACREAPASDFADYRKDEALKSGTVALLKRLQAANQAGTNAYEELTCPACGTAFRHESSFGYNENDETVERCS